MYKNKYISFFTLSLLFLLINGACIGMDGAQHGDQPAAPITLDADAPDPDQLEAEIARLKQEAIQRAQQVAAEIARFQQEATQNATTLKDAQETIKTQKLEYDSLKNNPRVVIQGAEWASYPEGAVPALKKKIETEAALYERRNSWWGTADNVSERIVYPLAKDSLSFSFNEWRSNEDLRLFGFNIGSGWYKTKLEKANELATEKKQVNDELVIESGKLDLEAKKQQKANNEIEKKYKEDLNDAQLLNNYINNLVIMCGKAKKKGEFPECDRMYDMAANMQEDDFRTLYERKKSKKYTSKTEAKS